ncbi:MAG TPA: hypothetical protein VKW06_09735 [Candidatus Angelobacter sp.]|nr:hypothetical protein [Candidatus Angelobacter sp.]
MRKRAAVLLLVLGCAAVVFAQQEAFHRAEQDRVISYWLLDPATHQFRISHDFTVSRVGQKYVHSFVRKGSVVTPDAKMFDLDSGTELKTYTVSGKDVNALGYYPDKVDPDSIAVQGDLRHAIAEGQSTRIRVQETYTDPVGYVLKDGDLMWTRTLGRPLNFVTLPAGWMLVSVNIPAVISLDEEGRIKLRFSNTRNGDLAIEIRARRRPAKTEPAAINHVSFGVGQARRPGSLGAHGSSSPIAETSTSV